MALISPVQVVDDAPCTVGTDAASQQTRTSEHAAIIVSIVFT
jgi:hypothetical protein